MLKCLDRVFLIGPMAAGKSSIGRHLADALGYRFADSDQEIEARCGADVAWIFDVEGEAGFRRRESQMLETLSLQADIVVATGGGAVLSAANQRLLRDRGVVIYLQASLDTLVARTEKDKKRPLLQGVDRASVLAQLLEERTPIYQSVAHFTVNTDHKNMRQSLADICDCLPECISSSSFL